MTSNEERQKRELQFTTPSRMHPAAIFFRFILTMKETIFGLGIGLIISLKESILFFFIFAGLFLLFLIVSSFLAWLRFTFWIEDGDLRIEQGVLIRKRRFVSLNRIHKIDISANVFHRLFHLAKVQIDTASSGEGAEVTLIALKIDEAKALQQQLKQRKRSSAIVEETDVDKKVYPKKQISWERLFIAGSTSGSIGFMFLIALAIFNQIEELLPDKLYKSAYVWLINLGIVAIITFVLFLLFLLWVLGIAGTMIKYGNFRIEKRRRELLIKRGLLEVKELTIPFDRIQAIGIEQSPIRQPFKFVRIFAVVAGGSFDNSESFPVLFPLLREDEVEPFLQTFLTEFEQLPTNLNPLPKKGRKYYFVLTTLPFALLAIPVAYFLPSFLWFAIFLFICSFMFGIWQHRDGGYHIDHKRITLRRRTLNKVTIVTHHRRIQSFKMRQHKLQQMNKLATVHISLIGSFGLGTHYSLKHVAEEDAFTLAQWYSYRKRKEQTIPQKRLNEPVFRYEE